MRGIQQLERGDLPEVVELFRSYLAWPHVASHDQLVAAFARIFLEGHSTDEEIPSLVYRARTGEVRGFIGSLVRRMRFDGQPARMACSSSLVVDPDARTIGVGALLMRRYLAGPQDLTITDTATRDSERLWGALGGCTDPLASVVWLHPLRPVALMCDIGLPRLRRERWLPLARRLARPVDRLLTRQHSAHGSAGDDLVDEPLTAEIVTLHTTAGDRRFRLLPDYEVDSVAWILDEIRRTRSKGQLRAGMVSDGLGDPIGWYLCMALPTEIWQVLHLAPWPGREQALVDHVVGSAQAHDAAGIRGRATATVFGALPARTAMYSTVKFLYHTRRPEVARAVRNGEALITGLDGDMWLPT